MCNKMDKMVIDFLSYSWPINYTAPTRPVSSFHNHPSASQFASHVQDYIDTELSWNAIAGPFVYPPFSDELVCSPLQTVPKRGSSKRRVVMDLSFPHGSSVNDGIPQDTYLGEHFTLRLPGIDRLVDFILEKGRNCLVFKKDFYAERTDSSISIPRTTSSSVSLIGEIFIMTLVVLSVYIPRP